MANTTGKKFGGRKKGAPNKTTKEIKEAYQLLLEGNLGNMSKWLKQIGKDNPEKAFDLILKLSDFVVPKLSRQEIKTENIAVYEMTKEEREMKIQNLLERINSRVLKA